MELKNVKIINKDETINNANIFIKDKKIFKIERLDGEGETIVVPGFIDTHTHGFGGYDAMDGSDAIKKISLMLGKNGTTSFFPTAMTGEWDKIIKSLNAISTTNVEGAKISGIHLEGPFISLAKKGAHNAKFIIKPNKKNVQEIIKAANGKLSKITIAPEIATKQLMQTLLKNDIMPTLGHGNASAEVTRKAIKMGGHSATHLWNAMSAIANRNPGMVEVFLQHPDVYVELITDLIHVDKEAIGLTIKAKGVNHIVIVTDSIRAAGLKDGDSTSGGLAITKKGNLITLKGTNIIAGSGATMHSNFKNMKKLGYSLNDIVAMTSTNAAISQKLDLVGEVATGFYADLVQMDKNFNIIETYINGKRMDKNEINNS